MRWRNWIVRIGALVASTAAFAGQESAPLKSDLDRARAFADYGRKARDPLALIVAARIRRDLGLQPMRPQRDEAARGDGLDAAPSLIAEARRLAPRDRRIAALADDFLASNEKGRERGPLYDMGKLSAGAQETYSEMRFAAGKRAEVYVEAAGRIALVVRDAGGAQICADDAGGPVAYCWWAQERDAPVRIEIVNRGGAPNAYRMVTN